MIQYRCKNCGITGKESTCSICGERTKIQSILYWCSGCNVPIYTQKCPVCGEEGRELTSDIRPVFPEERLLLELMRREPMRYAADSVWYGGNHYYINGKRLQWKRRQALEKNPDHLRSQLAYYQTANETYGHCFETYVDRFIEANKQRFAEMTQEAQEYIGQKAAGRDTGSMFISFSGGKDSTVVADLVTNALSDSKILHLYGDTTLEFPFTLAYVQRFRQAHNGTPFLIAKNKEKNFLELCRVIGPPSRVMRWCCTIFKTGALTRKIQVLFRNKEEVISFQGIRRQESTSRSKYERESSNSKIAKQKAVAPIIDWLDFDVWLYLLTKKLDFNDAYRYGYSRVGCWCCPNNTDWSEFLSAIYMPVQYQQFQDFLVEFAALIGKPDPEQYVKDGKWKARQGGNGLEAAQKSVLQFENCVLEEDTVNFELTRPITEELYELFRPFGYLDQVRGNARLGEVYVLDHKGNALLKLSGRIGSRTLKVSIQNLDLFARGSRKSAEEKIRAQLTKYQMCMGCRACESVCKQGAITVKELSDGSTSYQINDQKCIRCKVCVGHFIAGCYMRKVLTIRRT